MKRILNEENILTVIILGLLGLAPNLFPAAQAGLAKLSQLGLQVLLPSILLLIATVIFASRRGHKRLVKRVLIGAGVGLVATLGLEMIRIPSFRMGGMPGDMPRLLGVLLTDRFMLGPSVISDILGWSLHFWNGIAFGVIFTLLVGNRSMGWAIAYGQLMGLGFLLSPAVKALGIGFMGFDMPAMPLTVVLAHLAFGGLLGVLTRRFIRPSNEAGLSIGMLSRGWMRYHPRESVSDAPSAR